MRGSISVRILRDAGIAKFETPGLAFCTRSGLGFIVPQDAGVLGVNGALQPQGERA